MSEQPQQQAAPPAQPPADQAAAPQQAAPQQGAAPAEQKDDYLDKAFDAGAKKMGYGGKVDKGTREKITDGARSLFEKFTGKKVSSKISN